MTNNGWISIHEQDPPKNPHNPANSVQVLWCDADNTDPEYAQKVGCYWYAMPGPGSRTTVGMFDSGGGGAAYTVDIMTGEKRDLYWKAIGSLPKPMKR
jgi:hypothetical protein